MEDPPTLEVAPASYTLVAPLPPLPLPPQPASASARSSAVAGRIRGSIICVFLCRTKNSWVERGFPHLGALRAMLPGRSTVHRPITETEYTGKSQ